MHDTRYGRHTVIHRLNSPPFDVNSYLVACRDAQSGVVIDPSGEPAQLLDLIASTATGVHYILNTHGHADHTLANARLRQALQVPVCLHAADDALLSDPDARGRMSEELGLPPADPADIQLAGGDVLTAGTLTIEVIHTPGHTPGSVCYLIDGHLFTGDTLFVGAVGRTDLNGGSLQTLLDAIEHRLLALPDDTVICPGHNYGETPTSTIGREKRENPYITDFILDDT